MIAAILDHLWQSTVILCVAGLLTLLLRRNSAGARYWLWIAASLKFLVPLSPLVAIAKRMLPVPVVPALAVRISELAERGSEPFVQAVPPRASSAVHSAAVPSADLAVVLFVLWAAGCSVVVLSWFIRWRKIRRALSSSRPLALESPIPLRESSTLMEPGLVGLWKPVILLPSGLAQRLDPVEMRGILAHELCHYRRRDNLSAAAHMLVEALFWFYPPIWWLGARLIGERERACDESVLAAGNDAEVYAGSILKVCRFFTRPTIPCMAGVSGADLKQRVEQIMSGRSVCPIGPTKRLLVTVSITGALLAMALVGSLASPIAKAQAAISTVAAPAAPAAPAERTAAQQQRLLIEQTSPQKEVPFNASDFDTFVGYYRLLGYPVAFAHVYRNGDHLYTQLTAQMPVEVYAESPAEFFETVVAAQWSFVIGPDGKVTEAILHQGGYLRPWIRSSQAANDAFDARLKRRIKENEPSPGTEAAIRRQIEEIQRSGHALYTEMDPLLAAAAHEQSTPLQALFKRMGPLNSLRFGRVLPDGMNDYLGTFAHGQIEIVIGPLSSDGKIAGLLYRPYRPL